MDFFDDKLTTSPADSNMVAVLNSLRPVTTSRSAISPTIGKMAFATEALREDEQVTLRNAATELKNTIENIGVGDAGAVKYKDIISTAQLKAGVYAGVMAGDVRGWLRSGAKEPVSYFDKDRKEVAVAVGYVGSTDNVPTRRIAAEAYDERTTEQLTEHSVAWNIESAQQDEFAETVFPTIVASPDTVGFRVTVKVLTVFDYLTRNISGDVANYSKKNLLRAFADATILRNDSTKIIPVVVPTSEKYFVAPADVAHDVIVHEGESIKTAPLAVNTMLNLPGISQTGSMLENGINNITDSVDPAIKLQNAYIKVGDDVIRINTSAFPTHEFNQVMQGNYREVQLNFTTNSVVIGPKTKRASGIALTTLAPIVSQNLKVRLRMVMNGNVNTETGNCEVFGPGLSVAYVQNAAGQLLDMTTGTGKDVVDLFANAKIIGYDLDAYRPNINRRQLGQLIDTTYYTQIYTVALKAPLAAVRPLTDDGRTDTSDLTALINGTRIRTSNAAVKALLDFDDQMYSYEDVRDETGVGPEHLGVGRYLIRPYYQREEIDMVDIVNSLESSKRAEDVREALISKIRHHVYEMYTKSEYQPAASMLKGARAKKPTVIIATDPIIAGYLFVYGDIRTLGHEFTPKIVSTVDTRMRGKMFITFADMEDASRNTSPDPLSFGCMCWYPELTIVSPIQRDGATSRELAVSPRFRHLVNCPLMVRLDITGMEDVIGGLPMQVRVTAPIPTP